MLITFFVNVFVSNHTKGKNSDRENVEWAVVHAAETALPVEAEKYNQAGDKVDEGKADDEKVGETLDQAPSRRIHDIVRARWIRLHHWDQDEKDESHYQAYVYRHARTTCCFWFFALFFCHFDFNFDRKV